MGFKSDIEIAQECEMLPITQIAEKAGIDDKYLEQYLLQLSTQLQQEKVKLLLL